MDISPQQWSIVDDLFDAALDRPADQRAAFLDEACDDDRIRRVVEELLASTEENSFLEVPAERRVSTLWSAFAEDVRDALAPPEPERAGCYRLVEPIGRGGSGIVYRAERDDDAFEQTVAVKLLTHRHDSAAVLDRFAHEQQILADLSHPNIATLLDGGATADGRPFFAMEYVDGEPLGRYCDEHRRTVAERLRLFVQIGEAVHAAHRSLVVHRDLKPSNVLVIDTDDGPLPKLLDFGIAKVIGDQAPGLTQTGERWMTPEYAAPEQVKSEAVTTATDVYQLGVVLYELLSGRRPYSSRERSIYEIEQAVCEERPRPPSSVVTQAPPDPEAVGHARRTAPVPLRRTLQGDLDAIVMKALRKEPDERYSSAEAMVEDVRRYLEGRPVTAHRGTWTYRTRKFIRRHATGVATALAVVILALAFGIYHTQRLTAERDRAQEASETSAAVSGFMVDLFESANPAVTDGDTPTPADLLERGTERLDDLGDRPAVQAALLRAMGRSYVGLGQYNRADSLLHRSLQLQQAATGPSSPGTVAALKALGNSKRTAQRSDSARYYLQKALRIHEKQPQPDPEQTVQLLTFLGQTQRNAGDLDAAEASVRRAISLYESSKLDRPETLANARSTLAYVLRGQGKLDEAEMLYRTILAGKERSGDNLALAKTLNNLAYLLNEREAYGEAEPLYRKALSISRRVKGANHPESLMLLSNLAGTTYRQGKVKETEQLLREKAELSRQRYGETHWRVGSALVSGVGRLLMKNDECDRARPVLRKGLQIWAGGLGRAHPWTARGRGMLGICLAHSDAPGDASAGDDALARSRRDLRAAIDRGSNALNPFHLRDLRDLSRAYDLSEHAAAFDTLLANANRSNQFG